MKKRSLVAALAMLVVSAIVLTSSTYAWFATSQQATVDEIDAKIGTTDGSIYLSPSGQDGTWVTKLTKDILEEADLGYTFPDQLVAVSYDSANDKWFTGSITVDENTKDRVLTADAASGVPSTAINYKYYVYSDAKATVTLTPSFVRNSNFVYALVKVTDTTGNTTSYIYSNGTDSYYAITNEGTAVDTVADGIISSTEAATTDLKVSTAATSGTVVSDISLDFQTNFGSGSKYCIEVTVWAEGQDANCTGSIVEAQTNTIAFDLKIASANG